VSTLNDHDTFDGSDVESPDPPGSVNARHFEPEPEPDGPDPVVDPHPASTRRPHITWRLARM